MGFPVVVQNVPVRIILNEECVDMDPSIIEGRIYRKLLQRKIWSIQEARFIRHFKQMSEDQFKIFLEEIQTVIDSDQKTEKFVFKF
jgi:hypothetical protein